MKRTILFRFHENFAVCRNHLEVIRFFNPKTEIHGLYGGPAKDLKQARWFPFASFWAVPLDDPYWKWKNGDMCIRWWFREEGRKHAFDMLHVFEWDMVLLQGVDEAFKNIEDGVALADVQPLEKVFDSWDWVAPQLGRKEWIRLREYAVEKFRYRQRPLSGVCPGLSMSRLFLERYAQIDAPGLCNDEVRVPLFAQCFKMKIHNHELGGRWFNTARDSVPLALVYSAFPKGVKAFHPVVKALNLRKIEQILESRTSRDSRSE